MHIDIRKFYYFIFGLILIIFCGSEEKDGKKSSGSASVGIGVLKIGESGKRDSEKPLKIPIDEKDIEFVDMDIEKIFSDYFLNDSDTYKLLIGKAVDSDAFNFAIKNKNKKYSYSKMFLYPYTDYIRISSVSQKDESEIYKKLIYIIDVKPTNIYNEIRYVYVYDIKTLESKDGYFLFQSELHEIDSTYMGSHVVTNSFGFIKLKDMAFLKYQMRLIPDIIITVDEKKKIHFSKPVDENKFIVFFGVDDEDDIGVINDGRLRIINDDRVRVRSEPDLNGKIKGHLNEGDRVKITDKSYEEQRIGNMEEFWYYF